MDEVIPFALPFRFYPDEPGGKGYVYVLPSESFELPVTSFSGTERLSGWSCPGMREVNA